MSIYTIEQGYRTGSRKPRRFGIIAIAAVTVLGSGYFIYRPTTHQTASITPPAAAITVQPKITAALPWPAYGQSAYGVTNQGVLAASKEKSKAVPVASLAKVITAVAVLKQKPLKTGEQGPNITLNEQDVALYGTYISKDGSVVPVEAGEQLTEYQALQAMLMPSANNIADSLVRWAFGSDEAYAQYANKMAKEMGLNETTIADASGFSPSTVSTARDMVQFGIAYMQNPVLQQIAIQPEATIPVAGVIRNYNTVINKDGLVGIKVGNTDEAGRCFMVANKRIEDGAISVAVVLGAEHLDIATKDAQAVIAAGDQGYDKEVVHKN